MINAKFTYIAAWIGLLIAFGIDIGGIFSKTIATATPLGELLIFASLIYLLSKVNWRK